MDIKCDKCNKQFKMQHPTTVKVRGNIDWVYFTCKHCGEQYSCYYVNDKIRRLQQSLLRLTKQNKNINRNNIQVRMIQDEIKKENDRLKEKFEASDATRGYH